uniref:Glycosyltransferase N-terminal domain-containing protein n=1 Tax=Vitis vinifera TaxID=29760 RepID=F6H0R7_VITVI
MEKPHAVCIPYPAQGHINPMLKLAKLLCFKGLHITFVNTEFNHKRLVKSRGPNSLDDLPSFQFKTISDGLPPSDEDATQDIRYLCASTRKNCLDPFRDLLSQLNHDGPPVTCIVSDGAMSFTLDAAQELAIPDVLFWTTSTCGFMGYLQYRNLIDKGFIPLKDPSYLTNGYLDTVIDWIPGMRGIRLKDIPSFIRTTDPNEIMLDFPLHEAERAHKASALIFNTFDARRMFWMHFHQCFLQFTPLVQDNDLQLIGSNLWKEEWGFFEWLNSKKHNSVVYVNFGSVTSLTTDQLNEFAWGLANSNQTFLWIIRPDIVSGESAILLPQFLAETKNRGLLASWCPQEEVLSNPAVGGFLTHNGWNSTMESVSAGVPMICWPFFAEQQTNCRYCCTEWGIGTEIDSDVKRDEVERLVRELIEGDKGKEMKKQAMEWKKMAQKATIDSNGSSYSNLDKMINQVFLQIPSIPTS